MSERQFTDAKGVVWKVSERVAATGFSRPGAPQLAPNTEQFRAVRTWLVFESPTETRRLTAIPDRWENVPPNELERLLALATPVSKDSP